MKITQITPKKESFHCKFVSQNIYLKRKNIPSSKLQLQIFIPNEMKFQGKTCLLNNFDRI